MPSVGQSTDPRARPHGQARVQDVDRSLGLPGQDRPAWRGDGRHDVAARTPRAEDVRRLDRSDRQGRAADRAAAAAEGRRAQRRRDDVGLGHRDLVHPRRDDDHQGESAHERQRPGVGGRCRARQVRRRRIRTRTRPFEIPIPTRDDPKTMRSRFPHDAGAARPTSGASRSSTPACPIRTTRCSTARAGCGARRRSARASCPTGARTARSTSLPSTSRPRIRATGTRRTTIRRPASGS